MENKKRRRKGENNGKTTFIFKKAEDCQKVVSYFKGGEIDFEKIIPSPKEEIYDISEGDALFALADMYIMEEGAKLYDDALRAFFGHRSRDLRKRCIVEARIRLAEGERPSDADYASATNLLKNFQKFGITSFSQWAKAHWGSKSNASATVITEKEISFLSEGEPNLVLRAISKKFPDIPFVVISYEGTPDDNSSMVNTYENYHGRLVMKVVYTVSYHKNETEEYFEEWPTPRGISQTPERAQEHRRTTPEKIASRIWCD